MKNKGGHGIDDSFLSQLETLTSAAASFSNHVATLLVSSRTRQGRTLSRFSKAIASQNALEYSLFAFKKKKRGKGRKKLEKKGREKEQAGNKKVRE